MMQNEGMLHNDLLTLYDGDEGRLRKVTEGDAAPTAEGGGGGDAGVAVAGGGGVAAAEAPEQGQAAPALTLEQQVQLAAEKVQAQGDVAPMDVEAPTQTPAAAAPGGLVVSLTEPPVDAEVIHPPLVAPAPAPADDAAPEGAPDEQKEKQMKELAKPDTLKAAGVDERNEAQALLEQYQFVSAEEQDERRRGERESREAEKTTVADPKTLRARVDRAARERGLSSVHLDCLRLHGLAIEHLYNGLLHKAIAMCEHSRGEGDHELPQMHRETTSNVSRALHMVERREQLNAEHLEQERKLAEANRKRPREDEDPEEAALREKQRQEEEARKHSKVVNEVAFAATGMQADMSRWTAAAKAAQGKGEDKGAAGGSSAAGDVGGAGESDDQPPQRKRVITLATLIAVLQREPMGARSSLLSRRRYMS